MSQFELTLQRIGEIQQTITQRFGEEPSAAQVSGQSFESALNVAQSQNAPDQNTKAATFDPLIHEKAAQAGLDPSLVKAVVQAESGFNPSAVSPVGAKGLMQLMPGTAKTLGVSDRLNPEENIDGGTRYLKGLIDKYQSVPKALAAYNAGPGAVDKYGGIPPYQETQNYVKRVLAYQQQFLH